MGHATVTLESLFRFLSTSIVCPLGPKMLGWRRAMPAGGFTLMQLNKRRQSLKPITLQGN